jgi:enediyne biosynthesis protein E4
MRSLWLWAGAALTLSGASCSPQGKTPAGEPQIDKPSLFRDIAREAGLDYRWSVTMTRPLNILGTIGNGCALFDYDSDGNLDVLLVGQPTKLFKGDGKGKFTPSDALPALSGHLLGCAVGDLDNDGFPEVYLTAYQGGTLLKNNGGKTFTALPTPPQPWTTSATFFDANNDGKLDLYLGNYVQFTPQTKPQLCPSGNLQTACGPRYYDPEAGKLFLGDGKTGLKEVTASAGIAYLTKNAEAMETAAKLSGKALGVAAADFEGTGQIGLALANDEMPGDLLKNNGGRFENIGQLSGTAYDANGGTHGGMGVDWGDANGDGKLDLFVGTFQNEPKCLYLNQGKATFAESGEAWGLSPSRPFVTFGSKFLDFDNDGWLDLLIANGHVQDNIEQEAGRSSVYRQPLQLFRSEAGQKYTDASALLTSQALVGRGLAVGDIDNDGRLDALVVDSEGAPLLLHNESKSTAGWLSLELVGAKSNRDGYGATVRVTVGDRVIVRHCHADGSYMSASDKRIHVGVGSATEASVSVTWPGGKVQDFGKQALNQRHRLIEKR